MIFRAEFSTDVNTSIDGDRLLSIDGWITMHINVFGLLYCDWPTRSGRSVRRITLDWHSYGITFQKTSFSRSEIFIGTSTWRSQSWTTSVRLKVQRTGCWGEHLHRRGTKRYNVREHCGLRCFITYNLGKIKLGFSNQGGWDKQGTRYAWKEEECIHDLGGKASKNETTGKTWP
jgi:hypothetical protein